MAKKWFKTKKYGWGWTPATWHGWAVIIIYAEFLIWDYLRLKQSGNLGFNPTGYVTDVIVASLVLCFVSYLTGEKPRWRWGK